MSEQQQILQQEQYRLRSLEQTAAGAKKNVHCRTLTDIESEIFSKAMHVCVV